jgi:hypoxanthine phosphoribosyltransferase
MEIITVKDKSFRPYISEEDLRSSVEKVAKQINADYKGSEPLFLGVLNGSFMFFSDLLKLVDLECKVSFVKLASYEGTSTTGKVNELIGLSESIEGRDIIIVEDIVDTGNTLVKLHDILSKGNPKSIKIATLLYKPEAYEKEHPIDYVGLEIPNAFVLGYGLDYDGLGRNLSSIYVLNE